MNLSEAQKIGELFEINGKYIITKEQAKVDTGKDFKCLKKVNYNIDRLMFINEFKEHLINKGFCNIDKFLLAPDNNPYILSGNDVYVLTEWIDGRECDFGNIKDIEIAVKNLAVFHDCALGFVSPKGIKPRTELGKMPALLKKRTEELIKLKKVAQKGKNQFDYLFLPNVDFFIEKCLNSLEIIFSDVYKKVVEDAEAFKEICHRDYSYHNLIINQANVLYLINFDYCCYEIKAYDIVSLMRKILSECNWNIEVAQNILRFYGSVNKLKDDELTIIYALLEFPQKFWRIANRYYNSRRTRPETGFYNKLSDIIAESEYYNEFLENFKKNML